VSIKAKHQPCGCGCGELADECMTGLSRPLAAFTIHDGQTQAACFYCRRGMHDSCINGLSGLIPCWCCS
jgi:hypothetical protein